MTTSAVAIAAKNMTRYQQIPRITIGRSTMRLLLTSDWQAEHSNIDECEIALVELLAAAKRYRPDAIVNCGDCKDQYDPVSVTVIKFWVRAVKKIKDAGFRFIILRGNHDRISQSAEAKDWLDVLRAAGAETVSSRPAIKQIGNGSVYLLPFTSDKKLELSWANHLSSASRPRPKVLIFHTEVGGAKYGTGLPTAGPSPEDLHFQEYDACFGGHIHKHQRICDNACYVGNPFTMDWSDADQYKGHLLVDLEEGELPKVKQLRTSIPPWY